jgi:hypothetical protein
MRLPYLRIGVVALVTLGVAGTALAKRHARKIAPEVVTENSDPSLFEMIGSVMSLSSKDAEAFRQRQPRPDPSSKYLNVRSEPARVHRASASLEGGGFTTPYGWPGTRRADDEIGFYKDNFVSYSNSPLSGYYGWYGQISP